MSDFVIENGVLKKYTGAGGDVVIPDGVAYIGVHAFCDCSSLRSIAIPDGVTSIGDCAFYRCTNLQDTQQPTGTDTGNTKAILTSVSTVRHGSYAHTQKIL